MTEGHGRTRMCMALLAACLLAAWAGPAEARTVQKCVAASGHVTLTSGACAEGDRLVGRYEVAPEPPAPTAPVVPAAPAKSGQGRGPASAQPGARNPPRRTAAARGPDRCQAARDRRDRTLRRVGLKRTFDLLRKLDDEVRDACR